MTSLLIDFSWVVYRSYHAYPELSFVRNGDVVSTGTFYGLVSVTKAIRHRWPDAGLYWCMDHAENYRKQKYSFYKEGRNSASGAWDHKRELICLAASLGGSLLCSRGYEGDDVIATCARGMLGDKIIFGSDKDLLQLLQCPNVTVVNKFKGDILEKADRELIQLEWGVPVERILMLRSILGDPSDSIPRLVPRLREKIAVEMAKAYASPDEAWEHRDELKSWAKVDLTADLLCRWKQQYELMTLQTVPLEKVCVETKPADYWASEWGLSRVRGLIP